MKKRITNGTLKSMAYGNVYSDSMGAWGGLEKVMAETAEYYNAGVYGWNWDAWRDPETGIAVAAGYRNLPGKMIPGDLMRKFAEMAGNCKTWEERKKVRRAFFKALAALN